jgi:hypothetical protein
MKIIPTQACLKRVKAVVLRFIKNENKKILVSCKKHDMVSDYEDDKISEKTLDEDIFIVDDKILISGESGSDFSSIYVNYYNEYGSSSTDRFMAYMNNHGIHMEWENPGAMSCWTGDNE